MVSIIIPNYNHAPFLKKRIDSILNQTYQNFELIILDDCSTDNSKEIIEQYNNDPRISHIIYNQINSGSTFKQWEKGIRLAKGDYIWIAESDDWAEPFMLEKLMSVFEDNVVLSFCRSLRVWSEDDVRKNKDYTFKYTRYRGVDFIIERMLSFNSIDNASMAVFRKEKVDISWFQEISRMRYCGDWLFWTKLSQQGDVVMFEDAFNFFRQHPTKVTSKAQRLGLDFIEGVEILKYIEKQKITRIPSKVLKYWSGVWINMRFVFEKGVAFKTIKVLVNYKFIFLYYIFILAFKKKFKIDKK